MVKNPDGTAQLTLSLNQQINFAVLHHALVISIQRPDGSPVSPPAPGTNQPVPRDAVMVINPAQLAAGTDLTFNYLDDNHELHFGVVSTGSYPCGVGPAQWYDGPPGDARGEQQPPASAGAHGRQPRLRPWGAKYAPSRPA